MTDTTAAHLHPGDIVLNAKGTREYAAFDVHQYGSVTRIWTAISDQEDRGVPEWFDLPATYALTVNRRDGGPQVTHTVLTLHDDGSVAVDRH